MWSYFRGELVIPLITSWPAYDGDGVLPVQPYDNFYRIRLHGVKGNTCQRCKALTSEGVIEDLCAFCTYSMKKFLKPSLVCSFKYDKDRKNRYGWNDDDLQQIYPTLEIPAIAMLPSIRHAPKLESLSFDVRRIISNLREMVGNRLHYMSVKSDSSVNFYATRTMMTRAHSEEAWHQKNKKLLIKLLSMDINEIQKLMLTFDV